MKAAMDYPECWHQVEQLKYGEWNKTRTSDELEQTPFAIMFLAQLHNNPYNINIAKEYYTNDCIKEEILTEENDDGVDRFVELTPA